MPGGVYVTGRLGQLDYHGSTGGIMADQSKERGSLKLLQKRCDRVALEDRDLSHFIEAIDFEGIDMLDIYCVGQPKPDVISGSIRVNREVYDKLANRLLDLDALRIRRWEVFPYGIPVIDHLKVDLEAVRGF